MRSMGVLPGERLEGPAVRFGERPAGTRSPREGARRPRARGRSRPKASRRRRGGRTGWAKGRARRPAAPAAPAGRSAARRKAVRPSRPNPGSGVRDARSGAPDRAAATLRGEPADSGLRDALTAQRWRMRAPATKRSSSPARRTRSSHSVSSYSNENRSSNRPTRSKTSRRAPRTAPTRCRARILRRSRGAGVSRANAEKRRRSSAGKRPADRRASSDRKPGGSPGGSRRRRLGVPERERRGGADARDPRALARSAVSAPGRQDDVGIAEQELPAARPREPCVDAARVSAVLRQGQEDVGGEAGEPRDFRRARIAIDEHDLAGDGFLRRRPRAGTRRTRALSAALRWLTTTAETSGVTPGAPALRPARGSRTRRIGGRATRECRRWGEAASSGRDAEALHGVAAAGVSGVRATAAPVSGKLQTCFGRTRPTA